MAKKLTFHAHKPHLFFHLLLENLQKKKRITITTPLYTRARTAASANKKAFAAAATRLKEPA